MTRPLMTSEFVDGRTTPVCPHCRGQMHGAVVMLDDLIDARPFPRHIEVAGDGYADEADAAVVVDCPDCFRPSALAQDGMNWKLIACRTKADRAYAAAAAEVV